MAEHEPVTKICSMTVKTNPFGFTVPHGRSFHNVNQIITLCTLKISNFVNFSSLNLEKVYYSPNTHASEHMQLQSVSYHFEFVHRHTDFLIGN